MVKTQAKMPVMQLLLHIAICVPVPFKSVHLPMNKVDHMCTHVRCCTALITPEESTDKRYLLQLCSSWLCKSQILDFIDRYCFLLPLPCAPSLPLLPSASV